MSYLKYILILVGFGVLAWNISSFFMIDEKEILAGVSEPPTRTFIKYDEESIKSLKKLTPVDQAILEPVKKKDFGRKEIFFPDQKRSRSDNQ